MVALMVTAKLGISVVASALLAGLAGIVALWPRDPEPHDPEQEYQKLVARLRRGVE